MLTLAASSMAVWIVLRISASAAKMAMRIVFMGLLLAFFFYSRWLPDVALGGAAVAGLIAAGFLALLVSMPAAGSPKA